jgi:hypothetical protein
VSDLQVQSPEFKPQSHQKYSTKAKKKKKKEKKQQQNPQRKQVNTIKKGKTLISVNQEVSPGTHYCKL